MPLDLVALQSYHMVNLQTDGYRLLSYLKLASGGVNPDVDYASEGMNTLVSFNDNTWVQDTDLLICPLHFFHQGSDSCTSKLISAVELTAIEEDERWTISTDSCAYTNDFVKYFKEDLLDYTWRVVDTKGTTLGGYNNFENLLVAQQS